MDGPGLTYMIATICFFAKKLSNSLYSFMGKSATMGHYPVFMGEAG